MIAILAFLAYAFIGGAVGFATHHMLCERCSSSSHSYCMHEMSATGAALFWPVALPAGGGFIVAEYVSRRPQRRQAKHDRKLAELNAVTEQKRLDYEAMKLNMEFLERNGVKASVQGLEGALR